MLRGGLHPTGGGCLCLAGDCPHCIATVDGVGYARTCQVAAKRGVVVERHHAQGGRPPLIDPEQRESHVDARHIHCDVVVIGGGDAGREEVDRAGAAGKDVVTLDARDGQEVAGIYHGPLVVARSEGATLCVYPREEIVVATGAAEIQPVAPGAELAGLVTARAVRALAEAGIDLGRVVAVGMPPDGVDAERVEGRVVRFEGEGRVEAVVVAAPRRERNSSRVRHGVAGSGLSPAGRTGEDGPRPAGPSGRRGSRCVGHPAVPAKRNGLPVLWCNRGRPGARLGTRVPRAGDGQAGDTRRDRDVSGLGLSASRAQLPGRERRRAAAAVHGAPAHATAHGRRGRGRCLSPRNAAHAAPRRAPPSRCADGPDRRVVASLDLRRFDRRVSGRARGGLGYGCEYAGEISRIRAGHAPRSWSCCIRQKPRRCAPVAPDMRYCWTSAATSWTTA